MKKELKSNEYQCEACKEVFEYGWSEEEAKAEAEKNWGKNYNPEAMAVICDDCYKKIMGVVQN